jgi:hypothetical protein
MMAVWILTLMAGLGAIGPDTPGLAYMFDKTFRMVVGIAISYVSISAIYWKLAANKVI